MNDQLSRIEREIYVLSILIGINLLLTAGLLLIL